MDCRIYLNNQHFVCLSLKLICSNHSNTSLLNESSEHTIENRSLVHTPDVDILKKFNSGGGGAGAGHNNNNFINTNNNNNNTIHKNHKIDNNNSIEHKSGHQQCSELKQANVCSVQNRNDEMAVIRQEIDIEGDDINETDTHSTKSNFSSNIDVEIEKDERKPNLKNFTGIVTSATESNGWINCNSPDKLINETTSIYINCDNDTTTTTHSTNNGLNIMGNSLKKEVSLSYNYLGISHSYRDCARPLSYQCSNV